jgi:hypothetical protein
VALSEPDNDVVATQPAKSIQPPEPEKEETPAVKEKPRLSEAKIAEIRRRLASQSAEDVQIPGTVQCECDWDEEEKPMVSKGLRLSLMIRSTESTSSNAISVVRDNTLSAMATTTRVASVFPTSTLAINAFLDLTKSVSLTS